MQNIKTPTFKVNVKLGVQSSTLFVIKSVSEAGDIGNKFLFFSKPMFQVAMNTAL